MGSSREKILTPAFDPALKDGHYATKQIFCKDHLIAWSHRRRFETGLQLAARFKGQRLLDYGCGDGTFLALLMSGSGAPAEAVGVEIDHEQVDGCRARLGGRPGLRFDLISSLDSSREHGHYDAVVCMEVLEHVTALDAVVDQMWRALAPSGTLLVSVPVETGVPLFLKQAARRIAGWRGIGDYPGTSRYTVGEYWRSLWAGDAQHVQRPVFTGTHGTFHDHKGFNWMALRNTLTRRFSLEATVASPVRWLGPHMATQVWFVLRKDSGSRKSNA